jgi:hypothetical protein
MHGIEKLAEAHSFTHSMSSISFDA